MGAKRVLLVDDDVDLLEINRMTLERAGFEVVTADNGDEGFRVASSTTVDVAVLDVMMDTPTEGFELARRMRGDEKTKRIPLLMLTSVNTENEAIGSYVRFSDRDRDKEWLPVDRFVDKPIKPEDLISLVRTLAGAWTFSHK
jgi:CheY-like chemotaxis protein